MSFFILASFIVVLLVIVGILFFLSVSDNADPPGRQQIDDFILPIFVKNTDWRCVRIRPGLLCCNRVNRLSEQLFLADEAPTLPLSGCTEAECTCHYLHYGDRRYVPERRVKRQKLTAIFSGLGRDRRETRGRRSGDLISV